MKHKSIIGIISLLILVTAITVNAGDIKQVKVFIDDKTMLNALYEMSLDIVERGDDYIGIMTTATELTEIQQNGFRTEVVHEDVESFYQARAQAELSRLKPAEVFDMGGYKTLSEIESEVLIMQINHPTLISNTVVIGQTLEGRDIWAVKISDNPNVDEAEPEILYFSAIHAREVITPDVLLYFMNHLTDNYGIDPEITDIVDNRELWFILNVNPDGYYRNEVTNPSGGGMWRKNRRDNGDGTFGVDLNRNFGEHWGYDDLGSSPDPFDETYRGTGPFSEPESQALRDFIEAHEFVITVSYHSYSNLVLWPWGYDYLYTDDEDVFSLMGDSIAEYNNYAPGVGWTLYLVNGDTDDWGYGEQTTKNKNLSITFEVGSQTDGFWPLPSRIPALVSENLGPNIFLAKAAGDIYQQVPPKTPILTSDAIVDSISYDVSWSLIDTTNPAVVYELIELEDKLSITDNCNDLSYWGNSGFSLALGDYVTFPSSFYSNSGNNLNNTITTKEPYLVQPNDSITFQTKYAIEEDWDYAYVEVSTDGINFTPIEGNITTASNPNGSNKGHGITGSTFNSWIDAIFDISSYSGQEIFIRLTYNTDGFVEEDGFRVDDFYPVVTFGTTTTISSAIVDTFYNFSDKPTGTYYYKVRGKDAEDQWSEYSNIEKTIVIPSVTECYSSGDINNDGLGLSVADMVYLIRYLAGDIAAPDLPFQADLNGDCVISPEDTVMYQCYFDNGLVCFPQYPVLTCCTVDVDRDGDGYFDPDEELLGTNPLNGDSDGDSINDSTEIADAQNPLNTDGDALIDALDPDDDGDGILTIDEIANGDTDLDNIPDYLDDDDDGDGILTINDNCPLNFNPLQEDFDSDGFGDACDACCVGIRGNVDYDIEQLVDISDLVYLVAYMFTSGPDPVCWEESNIDGDIGELIDISDLVYLVDYMFTSGPPPPPCP